MAERGDMSLGEYLEDVTEGLALAGAGFCRGLGVGAAVAVLLAANLWAFGLPVAWAAAWPVLSASATAASLAGWVQGFGEARSRRSDRERRWGGLQ